MYQFVLSVGATSVGSFLLEMELCLEGAAEVVPEMTVLPKVDIGIPAEVGWSEHLLWIVGTTDDCY